MKYFVVLFYVGFIINHRKAFVNSKQKTFLNFCIFVYFHQEIIWSFCSNEMKPEIIIQYNKEKADSLCSIYKNIPLCYNISIQNKGVQNEKNHRFSKPCPGGVPQISQTLRHRKSQNNLHCHPADGVHQRQKMRRAVRHDPASILGFHHRRRGDLPYNFQPAAAKKQHPAAHSRSRQPQLLVRFMHRICPVYRT